MQVTENWCRSALYERICPICRWGYLPTKVEEEKAQTITITTKLRSEIVELINRHRRYRCYFTGDSVVKELANIDKILAELGEAK